jgi:hypothetical protein
MLNNIKITWDEFSQSMVASAGANRNNFPTYEDEPLIIQLPKNSIDKLVAMKGTIQL